MSYYSDVAIAIRKKDFDTLEESVYKKVQDENIRKTIVEFLSNAEKTEVIKANDTYIVMEWYCVKWYEEFPEVRYVLEFLADIKHYDFIYIGEDLCDIEIHQGTNEYIIDLERGIMINF